MKLFAGAVLATCMALSPAHAASVTYLLNNTNVNPVLPDGTRNYLSVRITDGATFGTDTSAIRFDVTLLDPLLAIAGAGSFGIDAFAFNTLLANPASSAIAGLPTGWVVRVGNQGTGGYGKFDIEAQGNHTPVTPTLTFWVTGISGDSAATYFALSTGTAGQGNSHYAAHVRGFLDQDPGASEVTSAWFGDQAWTPQVVPVPAAAWLLGSALGLLGWTRRRQR